ncbi:unnamed protein product [Phytophthora fragariaefolia]|uniref:Unnamed protein product n=1 Tax=Phytophthora fragariaefolia TaxID=1490495 RepID=A0A9W6XZM8_9STRA|nr:unnamed protein product [Phytophthora fragariaefolia]
MLRFVLSPLLKHSSARNQGTSSEGHRGETSLTTAPEETVIESEEEENSEPELQASPVPSKLYDISDAHNPYWYKFIKLVPRPVFKHLQKLGNKHARVAYGTKCNQADLGDGTASLFSDAESCCHVVRELLRLELVARKQN